MMDNLLETFANFQLEFGSTVMKQIDITSSAIEKGLDVAKQFLEQIVYPPANEAGLLIKDQITKYRLYNQIKILARASEKCKEHGISPKRISLKLVVPLLDGASLEEEQEVQEIWSNLIVNMVDAEENLDNHVFPFILGQLSREELLKFVDRFNNRNLIFFMREEENRINKDDEVFHELRFSRLTEHGLISTTHAHPIELQNYQRLGLVRTVGSIRSLGFLKREMQSYVERMVISDLGFSFLMAIIDRKELPKRV